MTDDARAVVATIGASMIGRGRARTREMGRRERLADRAQRSFAAACAIVVGRATAVVAVYRSASHRDRATVIASAARDGGGLTPEVPWR